MVDKRVATAKSMVTREWIFLYYIYISKTILVISCLKFWFNVYYDNFVHLVFFSFILVLTHERDTYYIQTTKIWIKENTDNKNNFFFFLFKETKK